MVDETDDSSISSSSISSSSSSSSASSPRHDVANMRIRELEERLSKMQAQMDSRSNELKSPAMTQREMLQEMMDQQQQREQSASTAFVTQLKLVKEVMTLMQPQPIAAPIPTTLTSVPKAPTFDLETIERLAKMFK